MFSGAWGDWHGQFVATDIDTFEQQHHRNHLHRARHFAALVSFLPYFGVVGLMFAVPAVVMGIIGCARRRGQSVVTPVIGLITGGIGLLFSGMWALMFISAAAS
jgi:hypothetical protein